MATATTEIYPLSLHDALPILTLGVAHENRQNSPRRLYLRTARRMHGRARFREARGTCVEALRRTGRASAGRGGEDWSRSEEHTSELQSPDHLVCRHLLAHETR